MDKILLAEDSPLYRKKCRQRLQDAGFEVVACRDGLEAYKTWSDSSVDFIITDLNMPELSGFELIRQIRHKPGGSRIPIIVATVRKQKSDVKKAVELGADDYLIKNQTNFGGVLQKVKNQKRKKDGGNKIARE